MGDAMNREPFPMISVIIVNYNGGASCSIALKHSDSTRPVPRYSWWTTLRSTARHKRAQIGSLK